VFSITNTFPTEATAPVLQTFEPGLFGPIEIPPPARKKSDTKAGKGSRGTRPVLSWRDFVLPELVDHADNGDPIVKAVSSTEQEHQTLHLLTMAQELSAQMDESRERRLYVQSLKRSPENADELAAFNQGNTEALENFGLWLTRKVSRKVRALERKANRLLGCSVIARPMDCIDCGLKGYTRFYCGNRYCRYCGNQVFIKLFAKYIRLQTIVERLICRDGFRPGAVLGTLTFTTANLDRMPTADEIRKFNHDVRKTLQLVCQKLDIKASQFGVLWCDEFGGWNKERQDYNTNLHCHGIWLGPFLPLKVLSAIWKEVRGNGDYRVLIESVPFRDGKPDFARALGHALKYTSKHVSTYSPERLAELELAFNGVRRVHTMGMFYNARETKIEDEPSATPLCPRCNGHLAYPKDCALQLVKDLEKVGRVDLEQMRREQGAKKIPEEVPS
jgi:hypothetical protein